MNTLKQIFTAFALIMGMTMPVSSFAEPMMDHSEMVMPSMTDGVIKKMDQETGKVTIKHGDIKHMGMPGMTMVFTVKNKASLSGVKPGDKVRFMVINEGGKMVVTDIQPAK